MEDFLYSLTDYDRNPESTAYFTGIGVVTMLKAICDVQRTILASHRGIANKDDFFDDKVEHLRSLAKQEQDARITLELKRILWELLIPPELFLMLFQKDLDNDTFIVTNFQYRRRKNLLVIYRGLQFLLEHKFEILININIVKHIIFPTLKEIVMEEYLPDITNDMIVCLIRAGSVLIRSEIWKFFLTARDGYTREVIKTFPKRSKKDRKDDPAFQDEPLSSLYEKQNSDLPSATKNFKSNQKEKKIKSVEGKTKSVLKEDSLDLHESVSVYKKEKEETSITGTENKLVTTKPWFSKSLILFTQEDSLKSLPISEVCDSFDVPTSLKPSISSSLYIYMTRGLRSLHFANTYNSCQCSNL